MSACLYPDLIIITPITVDPETSLEIVGTPFESFAYWNEDSRIHYGSNGQPLVPKVKVYIPAGTDIDITYKVSLNKKSGKAVKPSLAISRKVKMMYPVGDEEESHIEVIL